MTAVIGTGTAAPFLGLRYFDEKDSHLFFGREAQVEEILEKLRLSRFVTVMGGSGSGKSSLVRAGVIPALKAGFLSGAGSKWRIVKMRPGSSPIGNLARELERALDASGLDITLRRGPLGLVEAIRESRPDATGNVVIVADQFEELFRYQREADNIESSKEEAAAFVKLLLAAASQRERPIYVIVTMRSDYLGSCAQFRDLPEQINAGLYLVPRMRRDQLQQALVGPVAVHDAEIAPRLVQKLLNETGDDPDQLPVLQHALLRAWNTWAGAGRPLDFDDLDAGGMKESLSRHADEIFASLSGAQQRIARILFQQLSDRDAEGREIRRPAPIAHVAAAAGVSVTAVEEVAQGFASPDAAFLYLNEDGHLDITHESLLRQWRLIQGDASSKGWLQEEVDARDQFLLLVGRTRRTDTLTGRALEDGLRWRNLALNDAWAKRYMKVAGGGVTLEEVLAFLAASEKQAINRRRRRVALIAASVLALVVFAIIVSILWLSARRERLRAEDEARNALDREQEAKAATVTARDAQAKAVTAQGNAVLQQHAAEEARRNEAGERALAIARLPNREFDAAVAAIQAIGEQIESKAAPSSAAIAALAISLDQLQDSFPLRGHTGPVTSAVLVSKDRLLTAGPADTILWDVTHRRLLTRVPRTTEPGVPAPVLPSSISKSGRLAAVPAGDGTVHLLDTASGRLVRKHPARPPSDSDDFVSAAVFSPVDEQLLALVTPREIRLWNLATGADRAALPVKEAAFAAFSPDGTSLLTPSVAGDDDDPVLQLWDVATAKKTQERAQRSTCFSAAFSPDGKHILGAFATSPGTMAYQVLNPDLTLTTLASATAIFDPATFVSPGMISNDTVIQLEPDSVVQRFYEGPVKKVRVASDMAQGPIHAEQLKENDDVIVALRDGSVRLIRAFFLGGDPPQEFRRHTAGATFAALQKDGKLLVTTSLDSTARVWPLERSSAIRRIDPTDFSTVVFSPDGSRLAVGGFRNGDTKLIDTTRFGTIATIKGSLAATPFSPDGQRILTERGLWDVRTGARIAEFLQLPPDFSGNDIVMSDRTGKRQRFDGRTGRLLGAAPPEERPVTARLQPDPTAAPGNIRLAATSVSPDRRLLVTVVRDSDREQNERTARVYNGQTGRLLYSLAGHAEQVLATAFSSDGTLIATGSADNSIKLWRSSDGQLVSTLEGHTADVLGLRFSPDGRQLASWSDDLTIRLWHPLSGHVIAILHGPRETVESLAYSPTAPLIAAASRDNVTSIYTTDLDAVVAGYRAAGCDLLRFQPEFESIRRFCPR